ncbi:hypothetical protein, partial [Pantoea sp. GbtcB22]|uniref:hypothetical protein n=1 Tax=Pantoea sp. GbtcB22 TaxID=2824767 RepID=UPI001C3005D1
LTVGRQGETSFIETGGPDQMLLWSAAHDLPQRCCHCQGPTDFESLRSKAFLYLTLNNKSVASPKPEHTHKKIRTD